LGDARAPRLIDLFSGVGLGSIGFVRAGFKVAAAVDIDESASTIYGRNFGVEPIVGDLREVTGKEILRRARAKRGEIDLCVGCPPCQAFSSLRTTRRKKGQRDNRKSLLRVFGDRVKEIYPKTVVLENVSGLARGRDAKFLKRFVNRMRRLGYSCTYGILDAADFGVPQHRRRLILIGVRSRRPSLPNPTHANPKSLKEGQPWRTVREAISNLRPLESGCSDPDDPLHVASTHEDKVLRLLARVPADGGSRTSLPRRMWLRCHKGLKEAGAGSVYGRLRWDAPSVTITTRANSPACGRFTHPEQNRGLTPREAARLQSVPDDFFLRGTKQQLSTWVGNGMPPLLAEKIGSQVISYIR
jgi:DNA (cytosine-5)-methyltransferase 1